MWNIVSDGLWQTLFYARQTGQTLTPEELWERLVFSSPRIKKRELIEKLKTSIDQGVLLEKEGRVFWWPLSDYQQRQRFGHRKQSLAREAANYLKRIPFIKGIGLTGSVATGFPNEKDDLDFLIITEKNRVYLTRFLCYFLAWKKHKKHQTGKEENSWCFNIFLSEEALLIPETKRSLYAAWQLKLLRNLWQKNHCLDVLQQKNQYWLEKYLNYAGKNNLTIIEKKDSKNYLLDLLEAIMRQIQWNYMRAKVTREIITDKQIFFHPLKRKTTALAVLKQDWLKELSSWQIGKNGEIPQWLKEEINNKKNKIGLITGVFDLLHQGHLSFIKQASKKTDLLIIGLESDQRVKEHKGKNRPFYNQWQRRLRLQNLLKDQAKVIILPDSFKTSLIREKVLKNLKINFLCIGENDPRKQDKQALLKKIGQKLIFLPEDKNISMTKILSHTKLTEKLIFAYDRQALKRKVWKENHES